MVLELYIFSEKKGWKYIKFYYALKAIFLIFVNFSFLFKESELTYAVILPFYSKRMCR